MNQLDRKLFRDLWQMKGQALVISLVIASGMAMLVMSLSTLKSLTLSQTVYYDRYRFADVFAHLKRAPTSLAERIAEIPGVSSVQTRVVVDVTMDVRDLAEPAVARLISTPEGRQPRLNALHLRRGRLLQPGRGGEVLVSEAFADAHQFKPGDSVATVINGHKRKLQIVGVVLSPEYVLQIQGGNVVPDEKRFGVFWMGETELAAAYDMQGAFNDVTLRLMRGASQAEVIERLDRIIEPYGGIGAYGREDQVSHHYLTDEIRGLRAMAIVAPTLFLAVASFLVNIVLSRLISTQRQQIAVFKAFGYTKREVGLHYLKFVVCIAAGGVLAGAVAGSWLGRGLTEMYTEFYRFPMCYFRFDFGVAVFGMFVSGGAAVAGALLAVRRAAMLPPAEAMRPVPPLTYGPTILERLGCGRWLSQTSRMILRHLERRPVKSLLSCLGIALATGILVAGSFMKDAVDYLIEYEFYRTRHQHMSIGFVEPASIQAYYDLPHLPGVFYREGFRTVPARLRFGHRSRRVAVEGLEAGSRMHELLDSSQRSVPLPAGGLVLSKKLAEVLHAQAGDMLTLEVLEGERPVREVPVVGLIADYSGMNAYMERQALHRLMREGQVFSGAHLLVDSRRLDSLYTQLKNTPRVVGVFDRAATVRGFKETISENLLRMRVYNIAFACIIAFGVVYNTARISLSERARELASLRVLGFTRGEISFILLGELAVLTLAAIPIGLAIGYGFAALMVWGFETELYRIPLVIERPTYAFAATVTLLASLVSGGVVRRRLDELDLVAVLKSEE
jgi:putative ABC transport system permease protein